MTNSTPLPVTPEISAAYVAWEPPAKIELKMPRVLGLLRAAFFAGWNARADTASAEVERLGKALSEAVALIDEINERRASRDFNGINGPLHNKLCTIRATLARAALASPPADFLAGEKEHG